MQAIVKASNNKIERISATPFLSFQVPPFCSALYYTFPKFWIVYKFGLGDCKGYYE